MENVTFRQNKLSLNLVFLTDTSNLKYIFWGLSVFQYARTYVYTQIVIGSKYSFFNLSAKKYPSTSGRPSADPFPPERRRFFPRGRGGPRNMITPPARYCSDSCQALDLLRVSNRSLPCNDQFFEDMFQPICSVS